MFMLAVERCIALKCKTSAQNASSIVGRAKDSSGVEHVYIIL